MQRFAFQTSLHKLCFNFYHKFGVDLRYFKLIIRLSPNKSSFLQYKCAQVICFLNNTTTLRHKIMLNNYRRTILEKMPTNSMNSRFWFFREKKSYTQTHRTGQHSFILILDQVGYLLRTFMRKKFIFFYYHGNKQYTTKRCKNILEYLFDLKLR